MALKGTTKIELTNVKTGEKEVYEKHNLVTNAVNDILSLNPNGFRLRNFTIEIQRNDSNQAVSGDFQKVYFPIAPNMIGGILLYKDPLEEDPNKYFASIDNPLIGYSSNDVSPSEDPKRGSMNQTESGALTDGTGYRFVFDFATSQGNGTISAVGLTSENGGKAGHGSSYLTSFNSMLTMVDELSAAPNAYTANSAWRRRMANIVSIDAAKNKVISVYVTGANSIEIAESVFPVTAIGIRQTPSYGISTFKVVENLTTTNFAAAITGDYFYGTFVDGGDGYIWGFQHSGNAKGNASGSATVLWVKISKEDYSFTEGSFTVSAQLYCLGEYYVGTNVSSRKYFWNYAVVHENVLYAIKYTSTQFMYGIYRIPLDNPTDISYHAYNNGGGHVFDYRYNTKWETGTALNVVNGVVACPRGYYAGGVLYGADMGLPMDQEIGNDIAGSAFSNGTWHISKPCLFVGPYLLGTRNSYSRDHTAIYLQNLFLATINNLPTPVQKTADKTMKITYILREEN